MVEATVLAGMALAAGAAFSSAASQLFVRLGSTKGSSGEAVIIAMLVNLVVLVPLVTIWYFPDYRLTTGSILSFIGAGILGTLLGRATSYASIEVIGASRTAPVVSANALIATVLGVLVLGESLTPRHLLGVVFVVAGVGVIAWETSQDGATSGGIDGGLKSLALPFAAALAYGVEPIFASLGIGYGTPAPVGLVIKTVAATIGFTAYLYWQGRLPSPARLTSGNLRWFVLAGVGNTLFLLTYYSALSVAPVNIVMPFVITNTLFVVVLSALFMPQHLERVTVRLVAAAVTVVLGVGLITLS